jgi:cold shock CspA family protein
MRFLLDRINPICGHSVWGVWYDHFDRHGRSLVDFVPASPFSCSLCHRWIESGSLPVRRRSIAMQYRSLQRKTAPGEAIGTAKTFNQLKRYGFIRSDVDAKDVFVHLSAVRLAGLATLRKGQSYLKSTTVGARRLSRICG